MGTAQRLLFASVRVQLRVACLPSHCLPAPPSARPLHLPSYTGDCERLTACPPPSPPDRPHLLLPRTHSHLHAPPSSSTAAPDSLHSVPSLRLLTMAAVVVIVDGGSAVRLAGHPAVVAFAAAAASSCLGAASAAVKAADAALEAAQRASRDGAFDAASKAGSAAMHAADAALEAADGAANARGVVKSSLQDSEDERWAAPNPFDGNHAAVAAIAAAAKRAVNCVKEAKELAALASRIASDATIVRDSARGALQCEARRRTPALGVARGRGCGCGIVKPHCRSSSRLLPGPAHD